MAEEIELAGRKIPLWVFAVAGIGALGLYLYTRSSGGGTGSTGLASSQYDQAISTLNDQIQKLNTSVTTLEQGGGGSTVPAPATTPATTPTTTPVTTPTTTPVTTPVIPATTSSAPSWVVFPSGYSKIADVTAGMPAYMTPYGMFQIQPTPSGAVTSPYGFKLGPGNTLPADLDAFIKMVQQRS